ILTRFRTHGTLVFCQRNSTRDLLSDMLVILRVHILANVTSCSFPLPAWDGTPWTSTVCETEMGYRKKAYTILCCFARACLSRFFRLNGNRRLTDAHFQGTQGRFDADIRL